MSRKNYGTAGKLAGSEQAAMSVMLSEHHIPARLTADFGQEEAAWHVGGPVWRARKVKEENAHRFPDAPWHKLPDHWVPTNGS